MFRLPLFCASILTALALGCGDAESLGGRVGGVHPAGFAEADGHGPLLRATGDHIEDCLACHRPDDPGPGACRECHTEGPDDCAVCHREPVGSHAAHAAFDCATCHPVPGALGTPGHLTDRGDDDVRFSGLATVRGARPTYAARTCTDTACHAGPGAAVPAPRWEAGLAAPTCQACHGLPPEPHPGDRCDRCHAPVAGPDGALVDASGHLDGRVQAVDWRALPCDGCHGGGGEPWPPRGLDGGADASLPGVGAHAAHRAPTSAAPVACETCHIVPARNDAPGHVDDGTPGADVVFGPAAVRDAAAPPTWAGGQCANTACHGNDRPAWTGTAPCGTCHGLPPAGHPAGDCARCHPTAAPGRAIAVPVAHVDGQVDVRLLGRDDCADCHAAGGRAAPAGSHTAHARFECTACHPVVDEPIADHLDGQSPVTLGFGEYAEGRCSQTACHGVGQPVWGAAGSVTGCDACHGAPPVGHSEGPCTQCHPPPTDARHVNGRVDLELPDTCDACHGAPPATGAHLAHAQPSAAAPVACDACHRVPAQVQAPGHLGPSPAEVVLVTGRYEAGTCVDTDCHAGPGAADPAPAWEDGPRRCGDCHGIPPPDHLRRPCEECHRAVAGAGYRIAVPARHADGQVDFR